MAGFNMNLISLKLKEMYQVCLYEFVRIVMTDGIQMITRGGNAELELVDSLDPFSNGIIFSVMSRKKSWKNISNLPGLVWSIYLAELISPSGVEFSGTGFRPSCFQGILFFLVQNQILSLYFDIPLANAFVLHGRDRRCT